MRHKIICGKAEDVLPEFDSNTFDLIATDPPYNIGKDFENDNLSEEEYLELWKKWAKELNRVLDVGGALYLTIGWQYVAEIRVLFKEIKDLRLKNWIIWYRQDGWKGDNGFAQSHEHILYFIKDNVSEDTQANFRVYLNAKRKEKGLSLSDINKHFEWAITGGGCASSYMGEKEDNFLPTQKHYELLKAFLNLDNSFDYLPFGVKFNKVDICDDVWLTPKSEKKRLGHPTQKPVPLFERIIKASSTEKDLILDPFMGTGTTLVAAERLGRNSVGIDSSKENCEIAYKRLKKEVEQERLFDNLLTKPREQSTIEKVGF